MKGIKENIGAIILTLIIAALSLVNFEPGTWLSGWDTLHPEFNFGLYFKRIFFSVWQEHQGLGAVAAQAHAAELPRMLIYYPLSFILPVSFLRYSYFFSTLILGPLGVYFFLKKQVLRDLQGANREVASFAGGLFYLLNLGTLQQYYLPLEMFATHFATLPWLFLFATRFIENGKRKFLTLFSIATFFTSPIAHTATLFYSYFASLALFTGVCGYLKKRKGLKRALITLVLTLVINSYWLLPNLYFVVNHGKDVANSKVHTMFSEKAFLTGKQFGDLRDVAIFKNFLFDWGEYDEVRGRFVSLFDEWGQHLKKLYVLATGYIVLGLVLFGAYKSIRYKKKLEIALLPVLFLSLLFILNNNAVSELFFTVAAKKIPLFKEVFRFPFTKFSILLVFVSAVYLARAIGFISLRLEKSWYRLPILLAGVVFVWLAYYTSPFFSGNLISPTMRVKYPEEYFEVFSWFDKQKGGGRIAHFPVHTFWGWVYYDWQYEGAGFLWFGLKQPLLDREFDRWMPQNENYYWEVSRAVYSNNKQLLESVLEKYNIGYILLDKNIISPRSERETYYNRLENIFSSSDAIVLKKRFGEILVYKVNLGREIEKYVYLAQDLPEINSYKWGDYDRAYVDLGNYISKFSIFNFQFSNAGGVVYYPFRSLFSGRGFKDLEVEIVDRGGYFAFKRQIPKELVGGELVFPAIDKEEISAREKDDVTKRKFELPQVYIDGELAPLSSGKIRLSYMNKGNFVVRVPKIGGYYSYDSADTKLSFEENIKSLALNLPNLKHEIAYLISIETKNISGRPFKFWIENLTTKRADMEVFLEKKAKPHLEYFIQPPTAKDGIGYTLHFDNEPIGDERRINELGRVTVNPIPYKFLSRLKVVKSDKAFAQKDKHMRKDLSKLLEVSHPNPSLYYVSLKHENIKTQNQKIKSSQDQQNNNTTLVLSQAYDKGWRAYGVENVKLRVENWAKKALPFVFGEEVGSPSASSGSRHVLVNNWANGWVLGSGELRVENGELIIVYLPQYLQYFGFLLLIITPLIVVKLGDGRV